MSNFRAEFGYGLYIDSDDKLKDETSAEAIADNGNWFILDEDIVSPCLYRIDRNHEHHYMSVDKGLVLELPTIAPRIFGDTQLTFDDIIQQLKNEFSQYLKDDFDYENNLVAYDFVRV